VNARSWPLRGYDPSRLRAARNNALIPGVKIEPDVSLIGAPWVARKS